MMTVAAELCYGQVDAFMLVGKRAQRYDSKIGLGGFIKLGVPVSVADEITAEVAFIGWDEYLSGYIPLKAGYHYTLNREGYGWFVEPQVGYTLLGYDPNHSDYFEDSPFNGPVATLQFGYRFGQGKQKGDLSLRYENVFSNIGTFSTIGLRFAVSLGIGRRAYYE